MNGDSRLYLNKYLIDHSQNEMLAKHIELLKMELDWRLYYQGEYFSRSWKSKKRLTFKQYLLHLYHRYQPILTNFNPGKKATVLSTVYFNNFNNSLRNLEFIPVSPYWSPLGKNVAGSWQIIKLVRAIDYQLKNASFSELLGNGFQKTILRFRSEIKSMILKNDFRALLLYSDQYLYSKIAIDVFKEIERPSFILSHGLPAVYSATVDNRSDYLLVWGQQIKQNYINTGFDKNKILITGHPQYAQISKFRTLRNSLDNVLVLAKAIPAHQHTYETILCDPGGMIIYLEQVKTALKQCGVQKARLRAHPTMSIRWLLEMVGNDFYIADNLSVSASLSEATLVVGPASTVLLESMINGVNYLIFEPHYNGKDVVGFHIAPPFDASDERVPVARSMEELIDLINSGRSVSCDFVNSYLSPFDLSPIRKYI